VLSAAPHPAHLHERATACCSSQVFFTEGTLERMRLPGDWIVKEIVEVRTLPPPLVWPYALVEACTACV
jgi:hypothetical protein